MSEFFMPGELSFDGIGDKRTILAPTTTMIGSSYRLGVYKAIRDYLERKEVVVGGVVDVGGRGIMQGLSIITSMEDDDDKRAYTLIELSEDDVYTKGEVNDKGLSMFETKEGCTYAYIGGGLEEDTVDNNNDLTGEKIMLCLFVSQNQDRTYDNGDDEIIDKAIKVLEDAEKCARASSCKYLFYNYYDDKGLGMIQGNNPGFIIDGSDFSFSGYSPQTCLMSSEDPIKGDHLEVNVKHMILGNFCEGRNPSPLSTSLIGFLNNICPLKVLVI